MKVWIIAAVVMGAGAVAHAQDSSRGGYWVVGNNQTNTCDIVTSNPTLDVGGPRYFGTGPYNSLKDAKIARSTITQCPKVDDDEDAENK